MKFSIDNSFSLKSNQNVLIFTASKKKKGEKAKNHQNQRFTEAFSLKSFHQNLSSHLNESFSSKSVTGKKGEVVLFRNAFSQQKNLNIFYVGLGENENLSVEDFRELAGKACKSIQSSRLSELLLNVLLTKESLENVESSPHDDSVLLQNLIEGIVEGFQLSNYSFKIQKTKEKNSSSSEGFYKKGLKNLRFIYNEIGQKMKMRSSIQAGIKWKAEAKKALEKGNLLSDCVNFVRCLGDTPANLMTPEILSSEVVKKAKNVPNLKVTVWNKARIKKERMGGLYGVSLGSSKEPRFIIMEYKGTSASKKPLCFVGKAITFDSGGISLKPSRNMHEMKYDMCGGTTVIGAILAMARLKLKVNVLGLIPSSENMPGSSANKPGDILVARNGKSVEVLNTDAEGRMILMDALSYASEKKPQMICDAATLTGAMVVALGNIYTGVFTRKEEFWKKIQKASQKSGERLWRMPLHDFHVSDMKGLHADLSNISSSSPGAGSSTAAGFLESFVQKDIAWAHFDMAGTAWNVGNRISYCPEKGASGCLMRTFVALAEDYQ